MISDKKPPFVIHKEHLKKGSTMPNSEAIGATPIHELVNS